MMVYYPNYCDTTYVWDMTQQLLGIASLLFKIIPILGGPTKPFYSWEA